MKITMKNLTFGISPIALVATESNGSKPEDVNVNLNSEGASFGIEELAMEISIAEIGELTGSNRKASTTAPSTTASTPAAPTEAEKKANEALEICRAILHKINDLKEASNKASTVPTPSAPTTSRKTSKKAPAAPTVGKINNDDDEYI